MNPILYLLIPLSDLTRYSGQAKRERQRGEEYDETKRCTGAVVQANYGVHMCATSLTCAAHRALCACAVREWCTSSKKRRHMT